MLYRPGLSALLCAFVSSRNDQKKIKQTMLGKAFTERLYQLGISRREFVRRSDISRQTLHHIEHDGRTALAPTTYAALDEHLKWTPGTAYALANGDDSVLKDRPLVDGNERLQALRWRAVEHLQTLTVEDLERLLYEWERGEAGEIDQ